MGDISTEPSMEDILSSIKRIIAEEGDGATARPRRPARLAPAPRADVDDEILELSDPVRPPDDEPRAQAARAESRPESRPEPRADPRPAPAEPILSQQAEQASRGPLEALSRLVVKPATPGADTLEGMVRDMLRPMLREWLDANLPAMVETMVAGEIARITGQTPS